MKRWLVAAAALILTVAGCGGDDGGGVGAADATPCPLDALAAAPKPVEITYWHAMTLAPRTALVRLTEEFNRSQSDVRVVLSESSSYADNLTRFRAGLGTRNLPDLFQGEDTTLQTMVDSRAVLPVHACLRADNADTSDLVERIAAYFTVKGEMQAMPFNISNQVLYYNKVAFRNAGLDPEKPPTTLEELRAASQQLVDRKVTRYGIAIKSNPSLIEYWIAKSGRTIVDNGNGRRDRATRVTFDDPGVVEMFAWIDDMVRARLALSTGTADIDHYLAVGNGTAAMTIDSSAALGTIFQRQAEGEYQGVLVGTAALPGPQSPEGGVLVGGAGNYVINRSAPEKQAAAYRFAKFLSSPQSQATWAAATGYVPVSKAATTMQPLVDRWAQSPGFKVAYEQLLSGPQNDATAGPVIGPYGSRGQGMRGAIIDALTEMLTGAVPPADAVRRAAEKTDAAIAEYNSRVG
jgi:sn-glycerol 3-phosphate transport system substrate-binding protein